ncbi:MAG: T9SS type A sorting domain-containing protein [Candidatus Aegiribacteria sp.]|nr:T9SS type A sorting domain-containing protein [Candidatus Aegiribacteria sp.]
MKFLLSIILFTVTAIAWESSFSLPYGYVTGIGTGEDLVWAVDSVTMLIYGFESEYPYDLVESLPVEGATDPVGLAWCDSVLYYAQSGTAILHGMQTDGNYIGSWDFSGYGIQEISGVGWNHDDFYTTPCFLIADPVSCTIWNIWPPGEFTEVTSIIQLPSSAEIGEIGCGGEFGDYAAWVAFESTTPSDRLQAWSPTGYNGNLAPDEPAGRVSGTEQAESDPQSYIWVCVPSELGVYLHYYGLGISGDPDSDLHGLIFSSNPMRGCVIISAQGFMDNACIRIFDQSGRLTYSSAFNENLIWTGKTDTGERLPSGCYFVRVSDIGGRSVSSLLVKLE